MFSKLVISAVTLLLIGSTAAAAGGCEVIATQQYRDSVRIVSSLRPEKAGQQRVFATDGSEFTGGQAVWMQQQLRKVERLCAHGGPADQETAATLLTQIQQLLKSHQRAS
jgi:hypothetical protein